VHHYEQKNKFKGGASDESRLLRSYESDVGTMYFLLSLPPGVGVLSYMGHLGMCRCEGYGFQSVYSSIGYINQSVWV